MKKATIRRVSFLGLILAGASVVTAAVAPEKKSHIPKNGTLRIRSATLAGPNGIMSCIPDFSDVFYTCTATADTVTSIVSGVAYIDDSVYVDVFNFMWQTFNNTSYNGNQSELEFIR